MILWQGETNSLTVLAKDPLQCFCALHKISLGFLNSLCDQGQVLMEGTPERVVSDPRVIQAYLGE